MEAAQKSFFWNGILQLNEMGEHAFFDVKVKKNAENAHQVFLQTTDVPALPIGKDDTLRVTFLLENNVGTSTVRYKIADGTFNGSMLDKTSNLNQNFISVTTETSEWHFTRQQQANWMLASISVKVPPDAIRKFSHMMS